MVKGYFTGIDTRTSFVGFENVGGQLTYSSWLNDQMPYTIGARRAQPLFLEKDNLDSYVTVSNDAGYRESIGGELLNISQVNAFGSIHPEYLTIPASSDPKTARSNSHSLATGDINGNGTDDVIVGNWGVENMFALLQNKESEFSFDETNHEFYRTVSNMRSMFSPDSYGRYNMLLDLHLNDFNNDGFDDLIVGWGHGSLSSSIYFNDGGKFSTENVKHLPSPIYGKDNQLHLKTLSADFDRDGDQDLVVLYSRYEPFYGGNYLQYLENDGSGNFTDKTPTAFTDPYKDAFDGKLEWTNYWQLLDVNSDGAIDIVGTRADKHTEGLVLINDGYGNFTEFSFNTPDSGFGSIIQWGDFNQNGKIEYLTFETEWRQDSSINTFNVYEIDKLFPQLKVSHDTDGIAGQAYRIYKAAFDRAPDLAGLGFWINAMDDGAELTGVAGGFIGSTEFQSLYGKQVSDERFVELLYQNVLDRNPEQAGYDFWTTALDNGVSREEILIGFSESTENQSNVFPLISNGIEYTSYIL
jgi:hypothetical protein